MILKCSYNSSRDDGDDGLAEEGSENENEMGMGKGTRVSIATKRETKFRFFAFPFVEHIRNTWKI